MLNRPVRTRMPGGVGGGIREDSPYPDWAASSAKLFFDELDFTARKAQETWSHLSE